MNAASLFSSLLRAARWHRRKLAAVSAAIAVLATVAAVSAPDSRATQVVVTARALAGGEPVGAADVALVAMPAQALPEHYIADPASVIGRILAVPLPSNTIVFDTAIVSPVTGVAPGMVVAPVDLPAVASGLIHTGDHLDLYSSDGTEDQRVIAERARVVAVPRDAGAGGLLGGTNTNAGALVLVEVSSAAAQRLTTAGSRGPIGFALR